MDLCGSEESEGGSGEFDDAEGFTKAEPGSETGGHGKEELE